MPDTTEFSGKIFCIGFHKTGTTSLEAALTHLGYRVCGPVGVYDDTVKSRVKDIAYAQIPHYDAFQDNPWPLLYQELDRDFPGSKFILTTRPRKSWIKSVVNHFGGQSTPMREWIYGEGDPLGHEARYLARYDRHYEEVAAYFQNRPDDLLVLNLLAGDGWQILCPFLSQPLPDQPFPHRNPGAYTFTEKTRRVLRQTAHRVLRPGKALVRRLFSD